MFLMLPLTMVLMMVIMIVLMMVLMTIVATSLKRAIRLEEGVNCFEKRCVFHRVHAQHIYE
jgi:DNA phosphorothioation-dependent restriction protein DptG